MALARGSQVQAKALCEALDRPGRRHLLLTVFGGRDYGIAPDLALDLPATRLSRSGLDPRIIGRLRKVLRRHRPDVVVAHGSDALKYVTLAAAATEVVYHAISMVSAQVYRPPRLWLYRWLYGRADLVVGVSEPIVEECRRLLGVPGERLFLAPNGRDPAAFRPGDKRVGGPPTLAFVGHLTAQKHPEQVIAVSRRLRARGIALRALMVGDGPMEGQLRSAAADAGVELLGARDDVADILRDSDVVLFPSGHAEGMPGVLIEAGLSGVPVVATSVPGVSTVVDDGRTGLIVPEGDTEAMCEAVERLITDEHLRARMGAAARSKCERSFSLAASASQWDRAIDYVLERKRSTGAAATAEAPAGLRDAHRSANA